MNSKLMFTKNSKLIEIQKKQLFLSLGLLPLLIFGVLFSWFGAVGYQYFEINTEKLLFFTPLIVAGQLVFLMIKRNDFRWKYVTLSTEAMILVGDAETSVHKFKDLEKMYVKRDENKHVQKIMLSFGRIVIRLEGYFEMNTLRDSILLHQEGQMNTQFRLMDTQ